MNKLDKLSHTLYCITAEEYSLGRSTIEVAQAMIEGGARILQYREKGKSKADKIADCRILRVITRYKGVTFIVNDDVDIACAVQADGIHIGQNDMPIEEVRKLVGPEMIIGLSTHTPQQAHEAAQRGADYMGVGPIFATRTKKDVCAPVGFEYLEYVVKNMRLPFVAIGGIKMHNLSEVVRRGARCVAMVTEIVGADDIARMVRESIQIIEGASER